ncbi:MAG: hypothetical protein HGA31_02250 [Candidatus Moranbacteria bacterium]|nr:hypothetical protein [Candidatus Moranbacteria bacterium]
MRRIVVMNESHKLFPEQKTLLQEKFGTYEILSVPEEGWTLEEMRGVADSIDLWQDQVLFVSPVPYLLATLSFKAGEMCGLVGPIPEDRRGVYIFHNDLREKKELPGGRIVSVTATTGWVTV